MRIKNILLAMMMLTLLTPSIIAQGGRGANVGSSGRHYVYGDIKVKETEGSKPLTFDVILFNEYGNQQNQQRVQSNGRYRFNEMADGRYYIVVQYEGMEVDRFIVDFSSPLKTDTQHDVELEMRNVESAMKAATISAADKYDRGSKTSSIFAKGQDAAKNKKYDEAVKLFRQVVETDAADFPAWLELGTALFAQKDYAEAEKAYQQAIDKHPNYVTAWISLGRLRIVQKNFDGAIEVLSLAVKAQPDSAQANYFLGEAYLQ